MLNCGRVSVVVLVLDTIAGAGLPLNPIPRHGDAVPDFYQIGMIKNDNNNTRHGYAAH